MDSDATVSMNAFFTRQRANEGVLLPLALPDGSPTKHWIRIRGIDSDEFKLAESEAKRKAFELATAEDKSKLSEQIIAGKLELLAALIIAWSFEMPCTKESCIAFLREAPQIADEVDRLASRRRLFFAQGSSTSTPTPGPSSS